jgi:hypothetical protein
MAPSRRRPVARVHVLLAGVGGARPAPTVGSTRYGGLSSQEEDYELIVPEMLAEWPRAASPACIATMAAMASASAEKFRKLRLW